MRGISRYEIAVLALTAGFFLFTVGWFCGEQNRAIPYRVTTLETVEPEDMSSEMPAEETEPTEWPDSLLPGEQICLNTASLRDLMRLPGIGEKRAEDIIAYREEHGPFACVEEITEVAGIGEGILEKIRAYSSVEEPRKTEYGGTDGKDSGGR